MRRPPRLPGFIPAFIPAFIPLGPLLLLAGLLLTASAGAARIIQAPGQAPLGQAPSGQVAPGSPPPVAAAETGGQKLQPAKSSYGTARALDFACAMAVPFAFGAWLGWQPGATLAQIAATNRLWLGVAQPGWRAPRLANRQAARASAAAFNMRRRAWVGSR